MKRRLWIWALVLLLFVLVQDEAHAQDFYGSGNVLIAVDMAPYAENEDVYYPEGSIGTLVWGEGAPTGESSRPAFSPHTWTVPEGITPVPAPDYEIETVYELGQKLLYPKGCEDADGRPVFRPDDAVTREQLATALYRFARHCGQGFTGAWAFPLDYPDADAVSDWAYEPLCWLTMQGVVRGMDGLLAPRGSASRAQAAAMLMRYCEAAA